ncbi:hypothetical protein J1605_015875 [Eschrichtius robustus]|uniref:Uncharacterized protein n=1 Tax=Eschrichtius robustus TaxID=9764 RepID=A0AB34GAX2_ESCRO|nr:hypothetical protein J1605_015875 [Eschrichtius robustus]
MQGTRVRALVWEDPTCRGATRPSKEWFSHFNKMKLLTAALFFILLIPRQRSCAVSPTGCDAAEPVAGKALDLISKGRGDGYLFQLLRVADVHLDKVLWSCPWQS